MTIRCEDYDHVSVLALTGEFTTDSVELLRRQVEERLAKKVRFFVLDLEATTFLDSKALETILWMQEKCDEVLGQVRLCRPDETCAKILQVTRLDGRFDVFTDVAKPVKTM
jgi:anti-anti-sigma factor